MRLLILIIVSLFTTIYSFSQTFILSGKITDGKEPLAFTTIFLKGTSIGTNANADGMYYLNLPAGNYEIVFRYIGYTEKRIKVELNSDKTIHVVLDPEGVNLNELVIKAGEDPANAIIRKAIQKKVYYLKHPSAYSCKAYIKGLQKITESPEIFSSLLLFAGEEKADTSELKGVVYFSESESRYYFSAPDNEKEIMYSSRVSGNNQTFSFNRLGGLKINYYENLIHFGGLSSRPFISPLHDNAFFYYKYFLLSRISENGTTINKIRVVPKRPSDPCFRGIIYIQDESFRIAGIDLLLDKEMKLNFIDTMRIKQVFAPVLEDSIWMPLTLNLSFDFRVLGFKGHGYFNAGLSDYDLTPVFAKNFFNNELLKIEDGANQKDSAYWNTHRGIPLTAEETKDYKSKDSIRAIRDSPAYKDSVDKDNNKLRFVNFITGYNYKNSKNGFSFSLPGVLANSINYNTVEGLNLSFPITISKVIKPYKELVVNGKARYGFSNKLWGGALDYNYFYNPHKFSVVGVLFKSIAEQYNKEEPIPESTNSYFTLFANENFMKLFRETGTEVKYGTEIINGLKLNAVASYMNREPLKNTSSYTFVNKKDKYFSSNDPLHTGTEDSLFKSNDALTFDIGFSISFRQKFVSYPNQKIIIKSKYPIIHINYKKAVPFAAAKVSYDLINVSVGDRIKLGVFGDFSYSASGGYFITNSNMYFTDFKHFLGNQIPFTTHDKLKSYRLLPYYSYSSNLWFTELHAEHQFNGYIINKLPMLRRLKAGEVVGFHALSNERINKYYEVNFGLEKILNVFRLDYVFAFYPDGRKSQGFIAGFNLKL